MLSVADVFKMLEMSQSDERRVAMGIHLWPFVASDMGIWFIGGDAPLVAGCNTSDPDIISVCKSSLMDRFEEMLNMCCLVAIHYNRPFVTNQVPDFAAVVEVSEIPKGSVLAKPRSSINQHPSVYGSVSPWVQMSEILLSMYESDPKLNELLPKEWNLRNSDKRVTLRSRRFR